MGKFKDLTGQVFGRLTVTGYAGKSNQGSLWNCSCSCGGCTTVKVGALGKNTKSCGCLKKEALLRRNTSHGLSKSPEYSHWKEMNKRCFNENHKAYANYALRGISVHEDFRKDFVKWLEEIGPKPEPQEGIRWSVGRIDNNGWYTYGNMRWEVDSQQAQNHTKQRNNTSGIVGVQLRTRTISGSEYETFTATWHDTDGKSKTKDFSTNKYGFETAKKLATEYRSMKIKELNSLGAEYADSHGSEK